jgi:hypothetical protein
LLRYLVSLQQACDATGALIEQARQLHLVCTRTRQTSARPRLCRDGTDQRCLVRVVIHILGEKAVSSHFSGVSAKKCEAEHTQCGRFRSYCGLQRKISVFKTVFGQEMVLGADTISSPKMGFGLTCFRTSTSFSGLT